MRCSDVVAVLVRSATGNERPGPDHPLGLHKVSAALGKRQDLLRMAVSLPNQGVRSSVHLLGSLLDSRSSSSIICRWIILGSSEAFPRPGSQVAHYC